MTIIIYKQHGFRGPAFTKGFRRRFQLWRDETARQASRGMTALGDSVDSGSVIPSLVLRSSAATEGGKTGIYFKMDPRLHGDDTQVPGSTFYESIIIHS